MVSKLCIVGLLLGSQLSLASYDKNQVRKLGPNVKEAVNTAFEKGCKPEGLDALCAAFNMINTKELPRLTTIATEDVQAKYSLSNNQSIDIWNLSREAIVTARKNRKPEGPSFFVALADALERDEASKKMTYGERRIDSKLDASKRRDFDLAWQLNPDKISPATDKGLVHCNNAIINSNYQLNPTWQNWALTKGVNGNILAVSAALITAGAGVIVHGSGMCYSSRSVNKDALIYGSIGCGIGLSCLSLSFNTDGVKFSAMHE